MDTLKPAAHLGMGAIPHSGGTTFRVWAPHAEAVYVTGSFNDWSRKKAPLAPEGNGYWLVDVPEARPGHEYKYVIIRGSDELLRNDPYAQNVSSSVGNSIIHDPTFDWGEDNYALPPLSEIVIYEMHIGTFNDQPGGPPGNFASAIEKLSHLKELGINAIELMPTMEFPGGFSWGYNPAHLFAVESDYGGPDALKAFIKAAHQRGLAVIMDVVYNHFGPADLDIWQFDGWNENNKGGIYFYNDWRSETPWGQTRPDYSREAVRHFIRDNALMWLTEYRMEGLRWDMTAYIRNAYGKDNDPDHDIPEGWSLMQWVNEEIKAVEPRRLIIAEDLRNNSALTNIASEGGAGFDGQWDAGFVHPVREVILSNEDQFRNMDAIRDAILHRYGTDGFKRVIYTESHDEVANGKARVPEEISPGDAGSWIAKKLSTLGAALVFTAPGVPMIFQGQELLEDEWFRDEHPIDWTKKDKHRGILQIYRDLIGLRRNRGGHTRGLCGQHVDVFHVNNEDKIVAFHRWEHGGPGDSVVVVLNMTRHSHGDYQIGFPMEGVWRVRFNSDWIGYDAEFGNYNCPDIFATRGNKDGMSFKASISIGPYTAITLSQDAAK